jgi:hypothetical protein
MVRRDWIVRGLCVLADVWTNGQFARRRLPVTRATRHVLLVGVGIALAIVSVSSAMPRGAILRERSRSGALPAGRARHKVKVRHRQKVTPRRRHKLAGRQRRRRTGYRAHRHTASGTRAKLVVSVESTVGVNSFQPDTAKMIRNAGVTWDRDANTRAARSLGFSNLVVPQDGPDGNCAGDSVSQVVRLATSHIFTMKANGQHLMELCNETYLTVSAQAYAQWYDAVHKALAGTGITLGANAIWPSYCGRAYRGGGCDWMGQMIAELARINGVSTAIAAKEVDAWTIHPYAWPVSTYAYYIKSAHDRAVADGSTAPWWVTETAICLNKCWMSNGVRSERDQANGLTAELNDLVEHTSDPGTPFSWVTMWNWYKVTDTSDGRWGLMDQSCPSKCTITGLRPSYYALKTWMQNHGSQTNG